MRVCLCVRVRARASRGGGSVHRRAFVSWRLWGVERKGRAAVPGCCLGIPRGARETRRMLVGGVGPPVDAASLLLRSDPAARGRARADPEDRRRGHFRSRQRVEVGSWGCSFFCH